MNVAVHARIKQSVFHRCNAVLLKKQHRSSYTAKMWWRAVRMHWYSHPLILKSLRLTFINASILREMQRFCMSNEYFLFSLRFVMCLFNNRSIDTLNTCPLFQFFRASWSSFHQRKLLISFLTKAFFPRIFQKLCGIILELHAVCKMSDSFPADRHLDNLINYCIPKVELHEVKSLEIAIRDLMNHI